MKQAVTLKLFLFSFVLAGLTACGGGGGSDPAPTPEPTSIPTSTPITTTPDATSISGGGVKGPLAKAVVTVYAFDAAGTGFKGATVATATTDASAAITGLALPFPVTPPYILEFTSIPGTTTDITTNQFPVITTLRTVITQSLLDGGEQIYATPLTTMAVDIAIANGSTATTATQFEAALTTAASQVISTLGFGLDSAVDIFDTPPLIDNTTVSAAQQADVAAYRAAVEAVTAIAFQINQQNVGGSTDSVLAELARDLQDGGGINGSAGSQVNANTLQVLQQDPANLDIPGSDDGTGTNTPLKVGAIQTILANEAAVTAPAATDVAALTDGTTIVTVIAPAQPDPDIDGDGVFNTVDAFPNSPLADTDTDNDGLPDVIYLADVGNDSNLDGLDDRLLPAVIDPAALSDADDDNDSWLDIEDDFPLDDSRFLDPALDRDNDTVVNGSDNCPLDPNTNQSDVNADGLGDVCDNDADGDGIANDGTDNCPLIANPSQTNTDGDPDGDACDVDIDGDFALNANDAFPYDATETIDTDGDGIGNIADTDDDNDGLSDADELVAGSDSLVKDTDGDGVFDGADFAPTNPLITFNFSPVANDTSVISDEDVVVNLTLDVNDDGVATGSLVYVITDPLNGTLSGVAPDLTYTPAAEFNGSDNFTFTAADGDGKVSNTATVSITINAINDDPVTVDDTAATSEDVAVTTGNVLSNDFDVDGDVLTVALLSNASNGNVVANGDNTFTYTPNINFSGVDSFTYTSNDGNGGSATATVSITITAVNDNPVANTDIEITDEDTAVTTAAVIANDLDVDGDVITAALLVNANNGNVVDNGNNTFTYTPNINFSGVDSFTYTLSDGNGGSATGTVMLTVNAINDNPEAIDDAVTTDEDTAVTTAAVIVNDSDVDGDVVSAVLLTNANNGNVVDNGNNTFTYTPSANFNGDDSFTYTLSDGNGGSAIGTVNVTVNAINDAPLAVADSVSTAEDTDVTTADVRANDTDTESDALTVALLTNAGSGNVVESGNGTFTYTPNLNFNGSDSFSYTLSDGNGGSSTATVNIIVSAVNDPPAGNADVFTAGISTATVLDLLANDADVDGDTLTITNVSAGDRASTITTNGSSVSFTDSAGAGTTSFTYDLFDGTATVTGINVTVTITANIPPVANGDSATTDEDTPVTTVNVLSNDTDPDSGPAALSIISADVVSVNGGSVVNNGDNTFTYTPAINFSGADSFTYTVSDTAGSTIGTVDITVNPVNDPPVANTDSGITAEDTPLTTVNVLANDTNGGDGPSAVSIVFADSVTASGGVVLNHDDGTFTYTPAADFNGVDDFSYTVTDGLDTEVGLVLITVTAVNDAPVATDDSVITTVNTAVTTGNVLANDTDIEFDVLSISAADASSANGGTVTNNADGTFTYTPATGFTGIDTFSYTVTDTVDTDVATVIITVNGLGTPISMSVLMGPANAGVIGLESFDNDNGVTEFEYWTDTYDPVTAVFNFIDAEFNHRTGVFDTLQESVTDGFVLSGGVWVQATTINITAFDTGADSLAMDVSVKDEAGTQIEAIRISAQVLDISGDRLDAHLNTDWRSRMFDPDLVFTTGSKLITQYQFETLALDAYFLYEDDWCAINEPVRFATLGNNCNGIISTIDPTGYATTLDQVVSAVAWVDPQDGSTPPNSFYVANNEVNNTGLQVQLVAGGIANYYVIDWNNPDPTQRVSLPVAGVWVRDSSIQSVDMIRYVIPVSLQPLFANDLDESLNQLLAIQGGFVRQGDFSLVGDISLESRSTLFNGIAKDQVLANFSGNNYTQSLEGTTLYDVYFDTYTGANIFLMDVITFNAGGTLSMYDYQTGAAASTETGIWDVSATGVLHITMTSGPDAGSEWWMKVSNVNPLNGVNDVCAASAATGPFNCTLLDTLWGVQHTDETTAVGVMAELNSVGSQLPVVLMNLDGSRPVITGAWGAPFLIDDLTTATHTLDLGDETVELVFNIDGVNGTIKFPPSVDNDFDPNDINAISWVIDVNGVLRFTETDGSGDQWFWVIGYFDTLDPGNVLIQITTPAGQLDSADFFVIGGFDNNDIALAFTEAELSGLTQHQVFSGDPACSTPGWQVEPMFFDGAGNYTLNTCDGSVENGTYSILPSGVIQIVFNGGLSTEYIRRVSFNSLTGDWAICWADSEVATSQCTDADLSYVFINQTDAQTFVDSLAFIGTPVNASTVLAGKGVFDFWDDEWDGTQQVAAYWNIAYDGVTIVDQESFWSAALNKYLPVPSRQEIILASTGWQSGDDVTDAIILVGNTATLSAYEQDGSTVFISVSLTFEEMDVSGRKAGLFVPGSLLDDKTAVFSAGARWLKGRYTHLVESTSLGQWDDCGEPDFTDRGGNCNVVWQRQMTGVDVATPLVPAVDMSFLDAAGVTVELGWHQNFGPNGISLLGVFSAGNISYWTVNWDTGTTAVNTGITAAYTLTANVNGVVGVDIIEYTVPDTVPGYDQFDLFYDAAEGEVGILAVHNGFLRHGERRPNGSSGTFFPFNDVAGLDVINNRATPPAVFGTWVLPAADVTFAPNIITFSSNGNYIMSGPCDDPAMSGTLVPGGLLGAEPGITGAGLEIGPYTWDSVSGSMVVNPVLDTNRGCGLNDTSLGSNSVNVTVSGDVLTLVSDEAGAVGLTLNRMVSTADPIVGSWAENSDPNAPVVLTFFDTGYYELSQTCFDHQLSDGTPAPVGDLTFGAFYEGGIEYGDYVWDAGTGALTGNVTVDSNGWCGLHDTNNVSTAIAGGLLNVTIDSDVMTLTPPGEPAATLYRIQ